jgi:hypothetical protein
MRKGRGKSGKKPVSRVVQGQREALEREWFWAVLLDGDRHRIEQLKRMLMPAANDPFDVRVVVSPRQDQDAAGPPVGPSQPDL